MPATDDRRPEVARVDHLVDENGRELDVPEDSSLEVATELEETVGATSPTNWWLLGLVALAIVVAILLVLQLLAGGNPASS